MQGKSRQGGPYENQDKVVKQSDKILDVKTEKMRKADSEIEDAKALGGTTMDRKEEDFVSLESDESSKGNSES